MSFNIRDYVSDDHIENISEIAKNQSIIIQAMSLDNSQKDKEIERLNNIINRTTKYIESLSSSGRGCDIYDDIKQDILKELKGEDKE